MMWMFITFSFKVFLTNCDIMYDTYQLCGMIISGWLEQDPTRKVTFYLLFLNVLLPYYDILLSDPGCYGDLQLFVI